MRINKFLLVPLIAFFIVLLSYNAAAFRAFECEIVDVGSTIGSYSAIVSGSDSNKHIASRDISGADTLRYCEGTTGSWTCEVAESIGSSLGDNLDMVQSSDGNFHISHIDTGAAPDDLRYCNGVLGNWTCEDTGSSVSGGNETSIYAGTDSNIHIAHVNSTTLRYCEGSSGVFKCEAVTGSGGGDDYTSITEFDGNFHIVTTDSDDDLSYCTGVFGNWNCEDVETTGQVGYYARIVNADLNLHLVHFDTTENDIRHCNGLAGNWVCETITSEENNVADISLVTGDGNTLNIAYAVVTDDQINHCEGTFGNWECNNVDTNATNFLYTSMDYDADTNTFDISAQQGTIGTIYCRSVDTIEARFNSVLSANFLDPENGVTSITLDLNDTSITRSGGDINSWTWYLNGSEISTDQNTSTTITTAGDYNASLVVGDVNNFFDQVDANISIGLAAQDIDIDFNHSTYTNDVNIVYSVTTNSPVSYIVWGGTDVDANGTGTTFDFNYSTEGTKQICVIVNSTNDTNNFYCENFTATRFLVRIPEDEVALVDLTPFALTTTIPNQSYSNQSADLNVFTFFQTSDTFKFTFDINADYLGRDYFFSLSDSNTFIELQPYMVSSADGVLVTITVQDGFTESPLPNYRVELYKEISSVLTLVESEESDGAGVTIFGMVVDDVYTAFIYDSAGTFIDQENVSTSSTVYYWRINPTTIPDVNVSGAAIQVNILPEQVTLVLPDSNVTRIIFDINTLGTITSANIIIVVNDLNAVVDTNVTADGNYFQDVNFQGFANNSRVLVTVTVLNNERGEQFEKMYILRIASSIDILALLTTIKDEELTEFGALLFSLVVSILVTAWFGFRIAFDTRALAFVLVITLGVFAFIGWVPLLPYLILSTASLAGLLVVIRQ